MHRRYVKAQRCTARAKSTQQRCWFPAVKGKDKCRYHGGLTPIKHGLYSKYAHKALADLIAENLQHPDLLDIRQRIATLDALTQDFLRVVAAAGDKAVLTPAERESLARLLEKSTAAVAKLSEVEEGLKLVVRVDTFQAFVVQVQGVLQNELKGHPDLLARIARRLAVLGPGPSSAGPPRLRA